MESFRVRRFLGRGGEEVVVLTNRAGMPLFWPNVYVTSDYAIAGRSPNTSIKVLRTLGLAGMWAQARGRDLDADLIAGPFLNVDDVDSLVDFLGRTAEEQERLLERADAVAVTRNAKVVKLEAVRPDPRSLAKPAAVVANIEIAARVRWVAAYLQWHLDRRVGTLDRHDGASAALQDVGASVIARLKDRVPPTSDDNDDDPSLEGVDRAVLQLINAALLPGSPTNPFKSDFIQARNHLIWRLLYDTGARRHEVREALVDHVIYANRRFEIHKSKTFARTVPIDRTTADYFDDYIERFWSKLPRDARKRKYLLTDIHGNHLSLRAISRIFEMVRRKVPGIPDFMAAHTVRRSWSDRFIEQIEAMPENERMSVEEAADQHGRLLGWSKTSKMRQRYPKRVLKRKGDKTAEMMLHGVTLPPKIS